MNTPLRLDILRTNDIRCFGDSTGVLSAHIADGLPPYDFNWSSGEKNINMMPADTIADLIAGLYNVTVTDVEGCVGISDTIAITDVEALAYEVQSRQDNDCWNENKGIIELNLLGGTPPYEVNWSTISSDQTSLTDLANGNYAATITDNEGCTTTTTNIEIKSPSPIIVEVELQNPTSENLGSITVNSSGGTGQLNLLWGDPLVGTTSPSVADLGPGDYPLSIIDVLACSLDTIITLDLISSVQDANDGEPIFLYPNPSKGNIFISQEVKGLKRISFYNLHGQEVKHFISPSISTPNYELVVANLPSGLYYYQIETTTAKYTGKIVIVD